MQFDAALDLLERLNALQAQGLQGKQLIYQVLSDDKAHRHFSSKLLERHPTGSKSKSQSRTRNERPNHSIERTVNGLRPSHAAHVRR